MAAKIKYKKKNLKRRPARRANKKLITILGAAVMVVVVGLGSLWYLVEYRSADRNARAAKSLVANGNYREARKQIGRALSKEPNNYEYIQAFRDIMRSIVPATPDEAVRFYREFIQTLIQGAIYNPLDIDVQLQYVEEMYSAAYLTGQNQYWRSVISAVESGLDRISLDNPRRYELILYRGLALLHIEDASMTEEYDDEGNTRFPGESDIESVLELDPNNKVAWGALAHGRMAVYYRLKDEGRTQQAQKSRIYADETMKKAIEVAGDSFEVAMAYLREGLLRRTVLQQENTNRPDSNSQELLDAVNLTVVHARNRLLDAIDLREHYIHMGSVSMLLSSSGIEGRDSAIELLKEHTQLFPNDHGRKLLLSTLLKQLDRYDESEEAALQVLNAPQQPVCLESIEQFRVRPLAAQILIQLSIEQAASTDDVEFMMTMLKEAKLMRAKLADLLSNNEEDQLLLYADGIIALVENNFQLAAGKLEEVIRRNPMVSAQVYREAAFALAETGARGLAWERLAQALEIQPNNLANYLLKARIELMMSNVESAQMTLDKLPQNFRDNPKVQELHDFIALQQGKDTRFTDPVLYYIASSERAIAINEHDNAITYLTEGIEETTPPDWRLLVAMANVYIDLEDMEQAAQWIQKAIELNPDEEILKQALVVVQNNDIVAATIIYVESWDKSDAEKAETLAVSLYQKGMEKLAEASRWALIGNSIDADIAREIGERALAESLKYQIIAEESGADMSRITRVKLDQAILDKDMDRARELLIELQSVTNDTLVIRIAQVKLHLVHSVIAKDAFDQTTYETQIAAALAVSESLTEDFSFSDVAWGTLGTVRTTMGENVKALAAYAEAYRISPGNLQNIRRYVGLLSLINTEPQRLLRIIRLAREQFPENDQILAVWLEIEVSIGETWKVFNYRLEKYTVRPDDFDNALQLALLLVNLKLDRELLRLPDGTEAYSIRIWNQMKSNKREFVLQKMRVTWDGMIETIIEDTKDRVDPDIKRTDLHASVLRDYGRLEDAFRIWDRFIDSREGTGEYTASIIAASDFYFNSERIEQAINLLKNAIPEQSDKFEIDATLGSMYYIIGANELASESLSRVVQATQSRIIHARLIETLALSGKFDQAEKSLESFSGSNTGYSVVMLKALISRVKSEKLLAPGDVQGGIAELAKYRTLLRTAIELDTQNPVPYIRLIRSLLNEYKLTQNAILLDEALKVASEGEAFNTYSEEFAIVEADVLQAAGKLYRLIERLVRFVAETPNASGARQRLMDAYLDVDEVDKAINVAKAGVSIDPSAPTWHHHLGDLYLRANDDRGKAIVKYLEALQRAPTTRLILKIDEVSRTDQVLPYRLLLTMAQGPNANLHPIVGAIEAKALMKLGRRRDSLIAMSRSWRIFEMAIENGRIPEASMSNWFLDLRVLFIDDPEAGEKFVLGLVEGPLTLHHQASLAVYWQAFGSEYYDKTFRIIDHALAESEHASAPWKRLLMLQGGFLVSAGRYEESAESFRLLASEEDSPLVMNNLAYVEGIYLDDPERGLKSAKRAAEQEPRNVFIVDTVAALYERAGQPKKAAETLEYLLLIDPSNAAAMANLSLLYSDTLQQPDRALVIAERARSQKPRSPKVLDALGWSYYQTGKVARGEDFVKQSLRRGETVEAYLHLAQIVMNRSAFEEALGHLRMAEELAQDPYSLNRIKVLQDDIRKTQVSVDD